MTLLDGPDVVELYPDVEDTDRDGNVVRRASDTALPLRGRWEYDTASEASDAGQAVTTLAVLRCRVFPSGFAGRVEFDGRVWDVVGEPTFHGRGSFVSHVKVQLRARAPRVVA